MRDKRTLALRLLKLAHCMVTVALFVAMWWLCYVRGAEIKAHPKGILLLFFFYALGVLWLMRIYGAYHLGYYTLNELWIAQALADSILAVCFYIVTCLIFMRLVTPLPMLGVLVLQLVFNTGWLLVANKLYFRYFGHRKTALIYATETDLEKISTLRFVENKFDFDRTICLPATPDELWAAVQGMQTVIIAGMPVEDRNKLIARCVRSKITVLTVPEVNDMLIQSATHMQCFYTPMLNFVPKELPAEYRFIKRAFDITASFLGLVLLSPVFLATAIAVKACDGGPVFYRQQRLTKDGRTFQIIKFRSMKVNAERDGVAQLAAENDDRITPVGRFIRACRIDELPQLINILVEDMSIVGPRPERPEIAAEYKKELPDFDLRLQVRAGLTGHAQVCGKYNSTPKEKLLMDLYYISRMAVATDIKIILRTVRILFSRESTEGVEDGKRNAGEK